MTSPLIFIDGQFGTTGLQIHERLGKRHDLRLLSLPPAERKDPQRRAEALNACDIAILCLPDEAAVEAVSFVTRPAVRIIDASSAHRTHPAWTYGFPEMADGQAARIAAARRVSNPGCYPTGAIGLLRPLVQARLVPADYPFSIHAVSGYSGGGRPAVDRYEQQCDAPAFEVYGLGLAHKHPPEIQYYSGLAGRPLFVPAYGAFRQGIVMTIPLSLRLLPAGVDAMRLHACLTAHYAGAARIRVMPLEALLGLERLDPQALNGSNDLLLGVCANPAAGQVLLFAVFDNLGKGAAGAAVQNLDLMLEQG
jgi:N-acetyl-gamma-glutamyl-phosphate reductase